MRDFIFRFTFHRTLPAQEIMLTNLERIGLNREDVLSYAVKWFLCIEGLYSPDMEFASSFYSIFQNDFVNEMALVVESVEDVYRNEPHGISTAELLPLDTYSIANGLLDYVTYIFQDSLEYLMGLKTVLMFKGVSVESIQSALIEINFIPGQNAMDVIIRLT